MNIYHLFWFTDVEEILVNFRSPQYIYAWAVGSCDDVIKGNHKENGAHIIVCVAMLKLLRKNDYHTSLHCVHQQISDTRAIGVYSIIVFTTHACLAQVYMVIDGLCIRLLVSKVM